MIDGNDGTPSWAYDEDGYCFVCGNGRWKSHMPECHLRDVLDQAAIGECLADALMDELGYEVSVSPKTQTHLNTLLSLHGLPPMKLVGD